MAETAGQKAYRRGWRQGSVIPKALAMTVYSDLLSGSSQQVEPEGTALVLATQDCDLVKPGESLSFVEAIACTEHDEAFIQELMANNARYFVLDRTSRLVADRNHVVLLEKEVLAQIGDAPTPPCEGDQE